MSKVGISATLAGKHHPYKRIQKYETKRPEVFP
jgi:hypothetical protein